MPSTNTKPNQRPAPGSEGEIDAMERHINNFKLIFVADPASTTDPWASQRRTIDSVWKAIERDKPELMNLARAAVERFERELRPKYTHHHALLNAQDFEGAALYSSNELLSPEALAIRHQRASSLVEVFEEFKRRGVDANLLWR